MRIAVIGPQNTGKSTFIKDFLTAFPQFSTTTETYRDVIRRNNLNINQLTGTESQRLIRDFIANQVATTPDSTVFDRCLIDNYVYTAYAYSQGNIDLAFLDETIGMMEETANAIDLYLLIPTSLSVPLVADALRDTSLGYVDSINRLFIDTLFALVQRKGINVGTVGGTREERVASVHALLRAYGAI